MGNPIILGVDPGLGSTGVGVIEQTGKSAWRFVYTHHVITTTSSKMPNRLQRIFDLVASTIRTYQPDVMAVESVFFAKNVRSAVMMSHGRGVALLAAAQSGVEIREYSPLEIKQSVVGKGRASKHQVQEMVSFLLGLKDGTKSEHEADALACALCHAFRAGAVTRIAERLVAREAEEPRPAASPAEVLYEERKKVLALSLGRKPGRRR